MAMLMTPMAIVEMAKMATIVMAHVNFSIDIRGIQLKSITKISSMMLDSYESDLSFRRYKKKKLFCPFHASFAILKRQFFEANFAKIILPMTKTSDKSCSGMIIES